MKTTTKKVIINFLLIYIGSLIILYFIFKYGLRRQFFEWIMFQCQNNKPILGFIVMLFPLLGIILGYKLSFKKKEMLSSGQFYASFRIFGVLSFYGSYQI